jgi:RimJ/RimL family protein N-acetyltransferase
VTVLTTARLRLRPARTEDVPILVRHWSRPLVRRWLWDDRLPTVDEVSAVVESSTRSWQQAGYGFWIIEPRQMVHCIGTVGFRDASWEPDVRELVYSLDPAWWGNRLATEAGRAVITWAFERHSWPRVVGATDTPNRASARVLQRIGMRVVREGVLENGLPTTFYEISRSPDRPTD